MADADAQAIEEVFTGRYEELVARARAVLRSEADAEDAVQDAMLSVLTGPSVMTSVERIGAWIVTVVYRRSVDIIRRDSRRRDREESSGLEEISSGPDPSETMEGEVFASAVAREIDALPEEQRSVFVQNALDGMTFRQMSEMSGIPMGTLMARKKKAVDRIRDRLRRQGFME